MSENADMVPVVVCSFAERRITKSEKIKITGRKKTIKLKKKKVETGCIQVIYITYIFIQLICISLVLVRAQCYQL